ncbi:hypothetical protein FOMPIDRAFT_110366 [Fomitopsis schrenkii]|uniref:Uncharacterized protein n=1 Tax=Fomitopsis schrenkii TaxID=2126942 RepID=S8EBU5_FOMSC|nr:hypothetical protein FOMPIDRAFT_110366 [Fomitopsis schrenkii]
MSNKPRDHLPPEGMQLRDNFRKTYEVIAPSEEACDKLYEDIKKISGTTWYTKKRHGNWLDKMRKRRDASQSRARKIATLKSWLFSVPNPTLLDIRRWATELNTEEIWVFSQVNSQLF